METLDSSVYHQARRSLILVVRPSMLIPFDQTDSKAKYEFVIDSAAAEMGDGIILNANPEALLAFSQLFRELASQDGEVHIHLGYTEENPRGPGFRIVANNSGRSV